MNMNYLMPISEARLEFSAHVLKGAGLSWKRRCYMLAGTNQGLESK